MDLCMLDDFCNEQLDGVFLDQLPTLGTGSIWLLTDSTSTRLKIYVMGDRFYFAEVS